MSYFGMINQLLTRLFLRDCHRLLHLVQIRDPHRRVVPPLKHLPELEELQAAAGHLAQEGHHLGAKQGGVVRVGVAEERGRESAFHGAWVQGTVF